MAKQGKHQPVWEFLQTPFAQLVISMAILAMLTVLAVFVVRSWRDQSADDRVSASDLLTNYREMHSRGEITDAEFRTIKKALKDKLEQELGQRESAPKESTDAGGDD